MRPPSQTPIQGLGIRVALDADSIGAEGAEVLARCMASAAPVADRTSCYCLAMKAPSALWPNRLQCQSSQVLRKPMCLFRAIFENVAPSRCSTDVTASSMPACCWLQWHVAWLQLDHRHQPGALCASGNSRIRTLNLSGNNIGDKGAALLAEMLKARTH